jgi:hypothetical protein
MIGSDHCGSMNLLDESPHQAEAMSLTIQFFSETLAIVADGHGCHGVGAIGTPNGYGCRPLTGREGVVITVGDEFRENYSQRRYCIKIEHEGVTLAAQSDAMVRQSLNICEIEA